MKKLIHKRQRKWIIIAGWVICWQLLAMAVDNGILLAGPLETAQRLVSLLGEGGFFLTVGKSLLRMAIGFTAGFLAAVLLAAGIRRFPLLEEALAMGAKKVLLYGSCDGAPESGAGGFFCGALAGLVGVFFSGGGGVFPGGAA